MDVVGAILTFILTFASMIGMAWSAFGLPVGLVLLLLKAFHKIDLNTKTILLITFGGIGLVIVSFGLFFFVSVIFSFFGVSLTNLSLPQT